MERINVRVDEEIKRKLESVARAQGVSPSEVVRTLLEKHVKDRGKPESCLEIAERIGIVGVFKNTPTDLSTNPKHFEGFGRG